ncbi:hypothetical protein EE612_056744, partial [Oryza sativa]
REERS